MRRQICLTTHTRNSTIHDAHTTTLDVRVSMMTHSPATDTTKDCIDRQSRYAGVSIHHDLVSGEAEDLRERENISGMEEDDDNCQFISSDSISI